MEDAFPMAADKPDLSVVVPVFDEEENLALFVEAVEDALKGLQRWELIIVDDGSSDATAGIALACAARNPRVRLVSLARRCGQSIAMQAGFDSARAPVLVTLDGDLQNDPRDIPRLVAELKEGYDLVVGFREKRRDPLLSRRLPSWAANRLLALITGVRVRDNGCSLKAYRRELLDRMQLYSDLHRFIPAVAVGTAGARIAEVPVRHHPRARGRSKYGLSRVATVLVDLVTVMMIRSFGTNPFLLFGGAALVAALLGLAFLGVTILGQTSWAEVYARAVVFPAVSFLWFSLAAFLVMLGLIGQVAVSAHQEIEQRRRPLIHELVP